MGNNEVKKKDQKVGLPGAISFIVGSVIGAGIFVMSGALVGEFGTGMFICYIIGIVPALGIGLIYAQLGSAIPVTSGQYSYLCMFYNPMIGFMFTWASLLSGAAITATVCMGITNYMGVIFPEIPSLVFSMGTLLLFTILHIIGLKSAEIVQNIMVIVMVIVLAVFICGGLPAMKPELMAEPLFENGTGGLIAGAASLYFSYIGFNAIADIGEEVRNPGKTIPRSIIISAVIVGVLYVGVSFVMPRVFPAAELAKNGIGLAEAANVFLPGFGTFVTIAAIFAILTSVSACVAQNSRVWFVLGRDGWLPSFLSKRNEKEAPVYAIIALFIITAVLLATQWGMLYISLIGSVAGLLATVILSAAPIMLPKRFPEEYAKAPFKMPKAITWIVCLITAVFSAVMLYSTVKDFMIIWIVLAIWMIPGVIIYTKGKKKGLE